ncbi:MAG: HD domain-containing protein [Ruminococcaceae bacterium]|nr:HD domain-containing protein [Oscillospiraceae bacterium]
MLKYESLSKEIEERIRTDREKGTLPDFGFSEENVIRRHPDRDRATLLRPPFVRDIDKIMHSPYYNRYADKTQVFSFYKNDDLTRRGLHVQLVSRVARTIGKALNLNLELIEAIALGHDIGHTPFGHAGEHILDEIYFERTGRHFSHNIHSVRVLDGIFPYNISLQTLSGIAAHDGENELGTYAPAPLTDFETFDKQIEACYLDKSNVKRLVPSTLEGCVMRVSDIIAYLGKDRQDAERAHIAAAGSFADSTIGVYNAQIINNMTVNIIENSYGKPYIKMDNEHFEALKQAKAENYDLIYLQETVGQATQTRVKPMMRKLYEKLFDDLTTGNTSSPIFTHHISYVNQAHYARPIPYEETEPNQIVVDYIASMTDDYFIDLFDYLCPDSTLKIEYKGYFK